MRIFASIIIALFLSATQVYADGLLRPAFTYSIDKWEQSGSTTTTRQLIDFAAGYLTADGWAILGAYSMESKKTETNSGSTTTDRTSYGVGGGWYSKQSLGPYVDAIYFLDSKMTSPGNKYTGDGLMVDLGYKFNIAGSFSLGAQLTYRSFSYKKNNGATVTPPLKQTNLDPMLALVFTF